MLVFTQVRRQDHVRLKAPDLESQEHCGGGVVLDVAIPAQVQKLDRGDDDPGCVFGLLRSLLGTPGAGSFTLGSHQDTDFVAVPDFLDQHRRTPKFDVVGMRADGQDLHRISMSGE